MKVWIIGLLAFLCGCTATAPVQPMQIAVSPDATASPDKSVSPKRSEIRSLISSPHAGNSSASLTDWRSFESAGFSFEIDPRFVVGYTADGNNRIELSPPENPTMSTIVVWVPSNDQETALKNLVNLTAFISMVAPDWTNRGLWVERNYSHVYTDPSHTVSTRYMG